MNADYIRTVDAPTGHTVIQIDRNAQNSILLFGGANQMLTEEYVDEVLANFTGYFLAGLAENLPMEDILRMSAKVSSIAASRPGAVPSIPYKQEVLDSLR